ncbi:serpin family protein [Alloacidobacterium dinghuense]|uniref:Serpin family protein n=1 Tax=Alloacidobacterium dinghuense TaxID=2763107 RepID=A0A7G8BCL1_9BACT|nr:serpin family protein [Alloacidobacterium dinghuense]QNI30281.1 serpin family protein [Alloacidobacterium dinghuense]
MMKCLFVAMACLLFGASGEPAPNSSIDTHVLSQPYAQFGFDVLRELASNKSDQNIFVSPTNIAVALAMTSNGASGATRQAILQTLHADGQPVETFNAANRALEEQIAGTTAVQLSMANALWLQQDIPVNPSFRQTLQAAYSAQAENLDFRKASAVETINAWVAKHTNDRIPKILDQVDPSTVALLTNAIAFKGKWTMQFDPKVTQPHDFKMANGTLSKVQIMQQTAEYGYSNAEGLEAIRLPYADGTFAMYVVLPKNDTAMQSFLQQLTADAFTKIVSSLHPQRGTIELPRFTITYDATLNAILTKLGMGNAFSDHANFEGICKAPPHLRISEVRHASFLKVDEEGTEAAAATSVGIRATAIRIEPPPFHMVVDHPFFLAIRDERNGQIIFTGSIGKPIS